jgi:hypothetical protein
MMMKGPLRELIATGPQNVSVRLPPNVRPANVRLLAADKPATAQRAGEYLDVHVPSILDHEVVAIDLS